jgi:hypothetical protein
MSPPPTRGLPAELQPGRCGNHGGQGQQENSTLAILDRPAGRLPDATQYPCREFNRRNWLGVLRAV